MEIYVISLIITNKLLQIKKVINKKQMELLHQKHYIIIKVLWKLMKKAISINYYQDLKKLSLFDIFNVIIFFFNKQNDIRKRYYELKRIYKENIIIKTIT